MAQKVAEIDAVWADVSGGLCKPSSLWAVSLWPVGHRSHVGGRSPLILKRSIRIERSGFGFLRRTSILAVPIVYIDNRRNVSARSAKTLGTHE